MFYEKVKGDETLQEQMVSQVRKGQESYRELIVSFASSHGYQFTKEDLQAYEDELLTSLAASDELSEEEMETVAGRSRRTMLAAQFSVFGLGVACIASIIHNAIADDDCRLPGWDNVENDILLKNY